MFRRLDVCAAVTLLLLAAACGGGSSAPKGSETPAASTPAPATAAPEAPVKLPGESTITGRIKFEGTAPTPRVSFSNRSTAIGPHFRRTHALDFICTV